MIIHLNGWPGVGKTTIGSALSSRLGARFIHNHLLHDVAIVCAGFQGQHRWPLYETVRSAAYGVLAQLPSSEILVMTNALSNEAPRETEAWRHVVNLAIARAVALVPVVLDATIDETIRRVRSPDRVGKKLTDVGVLKDMMERYSIQRPAVDELIVVDVSDLNPEQSAETIVARLETIKACLQPATLKHLAMRR